MSNAEQAAEYLSHALRDLDRAADRLGRVAGAEPETDATKATARLVDELLRYVRTVLLP